MSSADPGYGWPCFSMRPDMCPPIDRLGPYLRDCVQVQASPDRAWVIVRVDAEPDLALLLALTSVAIKEHVSVEA